MTVVNTREEAKKELDKNVTLADKDHLNMAVVTVFRKDLITNDICLTKMFSDDLVELESWADEQIKTFSNLNIPFVIYFGNQLYTQSGDFLFEN